jgi:hypothetical protein
MTNLQIKSVLVLITLAVFVIITSSKRGRRSINIKRSFNKSSSRDRYTYMSTYKPKNSKTGIKASKISTDNATEGATTIATRESTGGRTGKSGGESSRSSRGWFSGSSSGGSSGRSSRRSSGGGGILPLLLFIIIIGGIVYLSWFIYDKMKAHIKACELVCNTTIKMHDLAKL